MATEIDNKYAATIKSYPAIGQPTTAEQACPDGVGRYRHYQGGSIYWSPQTGAQLIYGLIRTKWAALGWEKSPLGYLRSCTIPSKGCVAGQSMEKRA